MKQVSINLPSKYRLDFSFVKRRSSSFEKPFLPQIKQVLKIKKGSRISRYFRHVFEHKNLKKIISTNLVLASFVAINITPSNNTLADYQEDQSVFQTPAVVTTIKSIQYPVEEVKITQGYKFYHPGIDLDGITGDKIYPIMPGVVTSIQYSKFAYGNAVLISHKDGYQSFYAHLSKISVNQGQEVDTYQIIGEMGATGRAFGDHLHLEVYKDGQNINPLSILPQLD